MFGTWAENHAIYCRMNTFEFLVSIKKNIGRTNHKILQCIRPRNPCTCFFFVGKHSLMKTTNVRQRTDGVSPSRRYTGRLATCVGSISYQWITGLTENFHHIKMVTITCHVEWSVLVGSGYFHNLRYGVLLAGGWPQYKYRRDRSCGHDVGMIMIVYSSRSSSMSSFLRSDNLSPFFNSSTT